MHTKHQSCVDFSSLLNSQASLVKAGSGIREKGDESVPATQELFLLLQETYI